MTLTNNTTDRPAKQGIWITTGVTGTGTFRDTTIQTLLPGQIATQNDSPPTFRISG